MKILKETASCQPAYDLSLLAAPEDILFFDIETTGLKKESTQVYLIGGAFFSHGSWQIVQFLAESALDEREILEEFAAFARGFTTLVHFNGDGFDIPYLSYKADFYDIDLSFARFESIDIYLLAKPLKKLLGLPNMKQKTIEVFLKIGREDLYSGGALIPVYYEFERTGSEEAERLLLLHNFEDVEGMLQIVSILDYLALLEGKFSFERMALEGTHASFTYALYKPLPVPFETLLSKEHISVRAEGDCLQLSVDFFEGCAKLPLPDVENYYYLPEEDRVIHKDVAAFVDRAHRKKATKKNCFLRKEGRFLPQNRALFTPAYEVDGVRKKTFFEVPEDAAADSKVWEQYALDILKC